MATTCTVLQAEEASTADIEFLDYLGSMVEENGDWLDPMAMETIADDIAIEQHPTNLVDASESGQESDNQKDQQ